MSNLSVSTINQILDCSYDKAINGVPGLGTAVEIAESYMNEQNLPIDSANSLIRWQVTKCATSGFVTGLGGLITLPVSIPANITSVLYIQTRMIGAIAHIGSRLNHSQYATMVAMARVAS